ncbi:hypothetical protein [Acidovorax sp.]|uniref:hypothetical protein n=1 Tax=Acidovorax sp. TaxID=1872122 RepID=UPI00391BBAC2
MSTPRTATARTTTLSATISRTVSCIALCGFMTAGFAQQGRPTPPSPPPEAYTACQGKSEGDTVTLTLPDGKALEGTCRTINGALAAAPAGRPGGPGAPGG